MSLWAESRITLKLALPLIIGQVSQMLLGVADTIMLGHLGVTELAALTFTNSLFYLPFVFGVGILTPVSVFTSNARGARDSKEGRASCRNGLQIATAVGVFLALVFCALTPFLDRFGQPPKVVDRVSVFYLVIMVSMVPALMSMALKNHADAMDRPWPAFWIFLGGVLFNVFLNWVLIYGNLGFPQLGLEGAAWATLISRCLIVVVMLGWLNTSKKLTDWIPRRWLRAPGSGEIRRFFGIGIPSSVQMSCEIAAFSVAALLMGRFGEVSMAAHQIALMCAATAFMVPLGLSMALSVRIGEAEGRQEQTRFRSIVLSGWFIAVSWAGVSALVCLLAGEWLAFRFSGKEAVVSLATQILVVVGIFQIVDSLQITASSMLRGLHDTQIPAGLVFVSYWVVGIPLSFFLSIFLGWHAVGVWWGLAAGLAVACLSLCWRLWRKTSA